MIVIWIIALLLCQAGTGMGQLATAPWPMIGHDVRHTGQSPYRGPDKARLKWKFKTGVAVASSPALGSDGTVYVGSSDSSLYALSADGALKWKFPTGGAVSSPVLGSDGTLYVGSWDHYVYALEASPKASSLSSGGEKDAEFDEHGAQVFGLSSNFPNPFNPETVIQYQLPRPGQVRLEVYNLLGQKIRTLVDEVQPVGFYQAIWDGKDAGGEKVSSGIYFYRLSGEQGQLTRRMLLLR